MRALAGLVIAVGVLFGLSVPASAGSNIGWTDSQVGTGQGPKGDSVHVDDRRSSRPGPSSSGPVSPSNSGPCRALRNGPLGSNDPVSGVRRYEAYTPTPEEQAVLDRAYPHDPRTPGGYYQKFCGATFVGLIWLPDSAVGNPANVLDQRDESMLLPTLAIGTSPQPGQGTIVNLVTWLWVDSAAYKPHSIEVRLGAASAKVTRTPVRVEWDLGDGSPMLTCVGPGAVYDQSRPSAVQSTDCSHTFTRSSAGRPNDAFKVSATTVWEGVGSVNGGPPIALPVLRTTSSVDLRVGEVQAINTTS